MTWVFDPTPRHVCIIPTDHDLRGHFEGALWQCEDCGQFWELTWNANRRNKQLLVIDAADADTRIAQGA